MWNLRYRKSSTEPNQWFVYFDGMPTITLCVVTKKGSVYTARYGSAVFTSDSRTCAVNQLLNFRERNNSRETALPSFC